MPENAYEPPRNSNRYGPTTVCRSFASSLPLPPRVTMERKGHPMKLPKLHIRDLYRLVLVVFALTIPPSTYLCAYVGLSTINDETNYEIAGWEDWVVIDRRYTYSWMPAFFAPAGWLEAKLRRATIYLDCLEDERHELEFVP